MSKRLANIRSLRDAVVEGCKSDSKLSKKPSKKKKPGKMVQEAGDKSFEKWTKAVNAHLEDATGMSSDDLFPDFDWQEYYLQGLKPDVAAKVALQNAEEEEDTFGEPKMEDVKVSSEKSIRDAGLFLKELDKDKDERMAVLKSLMTSIEEGKIQKSPKTGELSFEDGVEPDIEREEAPELDDITRAAMAVQEDARRTQDEGRKMRVDFGRWGSAVKAASAHGKEITKSISESEGVDYKFHGIGNPQGSDDGSALWFPIDPKKEGNDNYYLGFQCVEESDGSDVRWDVMLNKGEGLDSSVTVKSECGIETAKLLSETAKMKMEG